MKHLLEERRDQLRAEYEAAKARLDEVERLLRQVNGDAAPTAPLPPSERPRRGVVQNTVLDVVTDAGARGLSVSEVIEVAAQKRSITLDRGTVSSLLSRFKRDNVLIYDGARYRLKQYAGPRDAA